MHRASCEVWLGARLRAELTGLPSVVVRAEMINVERARDARRLWTQASPQGERTARCPWSSLESRGANVLLFKYK